MRVSKISLRAEKQESRGVSRDNVEATATTALRVRFCENRIKVGASLDSLGVKEVVGKFP